MFKNLRSVNICKLISDIKALIPDKVEHEPSMKVKKLVDQLKKQSDKPMNEVDNIKKLLKIVTGLYQIHDALEKAQEVKPFKIFDNQAHNFFVLRLSQPTKWKSSLQYDSQRIREGIRKIFEKRFNTPKNSNGSMLRQVYPHLLDVFKKRIDLAEQTACQTDESDLESDGEAEGDSEAEDDYVSENKIMSLF